MAQGRHTLLPAAGGTLQRQAVLAVCLHDDTPLAGFADGQLSGAFGTLGGVYDLVAQLVIARLVAHIPASLQVSARLWRSPPFDFGGFGQLPVCAWRALGTAAVSISYRLHRCRDDVVDGVCCEKAVDFFVWPVKGVAEQCAALHPLEWADGLVLVAIHCMSETGFEPVTSSSGV